MKILLALLIILTFLNAEIISRNLPVMGTLVTINIEKKNDIYIQNAFNIIKKVDSSLSSFNNDSIISKLNKDKKVNLDSISFEALNLSKKYYQKSDGYFNITIGSITKGLYRFGMDENLPSRDELYDAKVDFNGLVFDKHSAILDEDIKVDLGGMGKGFGVDMVSEYLTSKGVNKAVISASGDIRCLDLCKISVQNPFDSTMMLSFKTKKMNLGITTSGNYNRFVEDKSNNHLINPKTKLSAKNFASITLVGDMKSSALDAYATAVSVMPKEKAYKFLDNLGVAYIVVEVNAKSIVKPAGFFDLELSEE